MPFVRSLVFKYHTYIVAVILSFGEIMPIYSCYAKKKLVCVTIRAPFRHQPFSYSECTKLNIYLSCDIWLVLDAKYL